jgi:hypothetical protein
MLLDELVARLTQLPGKTRTSTATMAWVPNPGPQAQAFVCEADELFYGGEAGGGKTDLGIGLALTTHKRSFPVGSCERRQLPFLFCLVLPALHHHQDPGPAPA